MQERLDELEELLNDISLNLRFKKGIDNNQLTLTIKTLHLIANDLEKEEFVPKDFALLIFDTIPSMISSTSLYEEEELEKINHAIDQLSEAIRSCLSFDNSL